MSKKKVYISTTNLPGIADRGERMVQEPNGMWVGEQHGHVLGNRLEDSTIKRNNLFKEVVIDLKPCIRIRAYKDFIFPIDSIKGRTMDLKKHNAFMQASDELLKKFNELENDQEYLEYETFEEDMEVEQTKTEDPRDDGMISYSEYRKKQEEVLFYGSPISEEDVRVSDFIESTDPIEKQS